MEDQREKCSGKPERKRGRFPYRPKDAPRPEPLANVPGPDHARFAAIRPYFMQRKDDAERFRREQLEAHRNRIEAIEDRRIRRELEREEAERQRGIDEFWWSMNRKVKVGRDAARDQSAPDRGAERGPAARGTRTPKPPFALAAYSGPILDRRGRVGVFMSSTYLSAKTSAYGCMKRLSYYVTKAESLEQVEGEGAYFSNMGETRHEIAEGMSLVEDANRAARANAKVAVTFVVQLPHDVTPKERLRILRVWCEEKLGVHDLPYVAALHKPSKEGDQRNYHGHVVTSFRPAYRTGPYAWRVARGLRTDLDNPTMFEELRCDFATIMTAVVQIAGKDRIYTHLSHAARGLKHKPTEKLGPHKVKLVREGEHVPANARNARTIATNEALAAVERIDERNARLRRRVARLAALKAAVARPLSILAEPPVRGLAAPAWPSPPMGSRALPELSTALLAAASRVADGLRLPTGAASPFAEDATLLTDAPNLHDAAMLEDIAMRVPSSGVLVQPPMDRLHSPSLAIIAPRRADHVVRWPATPRDVDRDRAVAVLPSQRITIAKPAATSARRLSAISPVRRQRSEVRSPSTTGTLLPAATPAKKVSQVALVATSVVPATWPSQPAPVEQGQAPRAVHPAAVMLVRRQDVACRSVSAAVPAQHRDHVSAASISTIVDVEYPAPAKARKPTKPLVIAPAMFEPARSLDLSPEWISWVEARVGEIERDAKAQADTAAAQMAEAQRIREHDRYIRFLALIALHADWLEDGERGLVMASHAPTNASELYASWQNDHERLRTVAEVRQAVLDGVHRLPPDLARDIARTVEGVSRRLPAPPPLRDAKGRLAPVAELAMALVADTPRWAPVSGDLMKLPSDAPPALVTIVARYRHDRALLALLAAAARHGEGIAGALEPNLARRLDHRRAGFALRRARGKLPVTEANGVRLALPMIEHLAQARLHADWIVHHPHLGVGVSEAASRLFGEQWMQWNDPKLARRLMIDSASLPAADQFMTLAMRAQVTARVQALAGRAGTSDRPGRDLGDRSR
jgi:hypothetical protein